MGNASHVLLNGEVKPISAAKDMILNQNETFAKKALDHKAAFSESFKAFI